jgi:hypothetical protein
MAPAPIPLDSFCCWARRWVHVTGTFTYGLYCCVISGAWLGPRLFAEPSAHALARKTWMIAAVWCLVAFPLALFGRFGRPESEVGMPRPGDRKNWLPILLGACFLLSVSESRQIWAAPGACFSLFGLVWLRSTPAQRRWPIVPVGLLWGGIYPLTLAWPNEQRLYLGFLIGGIAVTLQGIVEIVRSLRQLADGHVPSAHDAFSPPSSL